eukprot:6210912-Pleurochrysis_carterae.AAC.2
MLRAKHAMSKSSPSSRLFASRCDRKLNMADSNSRSFPPQRARRWRRCQRRCQPDAPLSSRGCT